MRQVEAPGLDATLTESFDRLCGLAAGPVCLGVSGGGDSMALLVLAAEWARQRDRPLLALTVDHGLRPEAAGEARFVAGVAAHLGVAHTTLKWTAPEPGQAKARAARHALLAQAAGAAGSRLILTAHTEDDQAETFLIRARAGSGWYGLAGIQPVALSPATGQAALIARPLLATSRAGLRDELHARAQRWIEDPSNDNPAYERVRMRNRLRQTPGLRDRVLACQGKLQLLRQLQDRRTGQWLARHVRARPDGAVQADAPLPPGTCGLRALSAMIGLAAGRSAQPRSDALSRLARRLTASRPFRPATLGGAIVSRADDAICAIAEHGLAPEQVNAIPERLTMLGTAYSGRI